MDEATRLVHELQGRLAALDNKVLQYRRNMTEDFTKYAEELLKDVDEDVSQKVQKIIAESMKDYKSLGLEATTNSIESGSGTSSARPEPNSAGRLQTTWPMAIPREEEEEEDEEESEEMARSPHEREIEFQGVFTPAYLPLLDSTDRNERRGSCDTPRTPRSPKSPVVERDSKGKGKSIDVGLGSVDASTDTRSLTSTPEPPKPPIPKRQNTDEASIGSSELSESGTTRRSALRRSSTSSNTNRASPRRVRFDVEGEEVLPTESPYSSQLSMATSKDVPMEYESLSLVYDSGDDDEQQIEDIEEERPPTKRVSSSQQLLQLSRRPLDEEENVQWTTVSAPPDGSASVATSGGPMSTESSSDDLLYANDYSRAHVDAAAHEQEKVSTFTTRDLQRSSLRIHIPGANLEELHTEPETSDSDDSDSDVLNMPLSRSLKKLKGEKTAEIVGEKTAGFVDEKPTEIVDEKAAGSIYAPSSTAEFMGTPTTSSTDGRSVRSLTASTRSPGVSLEPIREPRHKPPYSSEDSRCSLSVQDDETVFPFDEREYIEPLRRPEFSPTSPISPVSPVSPASPEGGLPIKKKVISLMAESPARPIFAGNERRTFSATSSVGSYKGNLFGMSVASDEIQAKAASVGETPQFFVGSMKGTSGFDESDIRTYKLSLGKPQKKPHPGEMAERLRLEEEAEMEAAEKEAARKAAERKAKGLDSDDDDMD
ncbi:hypothetical protein HYALB_00001909 [Hymenoscyphus albidus]|uniref:Uncharacterized protein n=1 Tax=Hymenoscyphus albidus TaxID=595503 RepID=A0A9N9LGB3_9HELO|nr:hypothetical protein HYALB_00001909 [Hymenoscyphus albidus]